MATQCLLLNKSKTMLVRADGALTAGVTAKDLVLSIIGRIGTAGGTGHAIEFGGDAIRAPSNTGARSSATRVPGSTARTSSTPQW